jgi:hypothetical protein
VRVGSVSRVLIGGVDLGFGLWATRGVVVVSQSRVLVRNLIVNIFDVLKLGLRWDVILFNK